MKRTLLAGLLLSGLVVGGLWAKEAPPASGPSRVAAQQQLFDFEFHNEDLQSVLQKLAKVMGRTLIGPTGLTGKVTLSLHQVTAEAALARVLATQKRPLEYKLVGSNLYVQRMKAVAGKTDTRARHGYAQGEESEGRRAGEASVNRPKPLMYTTRAVGQLEQNEPSNTESYDSVPENGYFNPRQQPLSTFSIDVDTASYANVRRFLNEGQRPPAGAVRLEELINYFSYSYPEPKGDDPFSVTTETVQCPWASTHRLMSVGVQGRHLSAKQTPPCNLVFLVDVSGSMESPDKLPLLKKSLRGLVDTLREQDKVSIVVYAGSEGVALPPTSGANKTAINDCLDQLRPGGSTNGAAGINLAYKLATENFRKDGINRVILCTDGDFNVGVSNQSDLVSLIEKQRAGGVFLSVLGFGTGNLKDSTMEKLADKGNGNYAYIDSLFEARKVLVEQGGGTLVAIAKDVKVQVEFNPEVVGAYRLLGYENRMLHAQDFNDDKKDAGEIGAGQSVTALYELIPPGEAVPGGKVDPLKYQTPAGAGTSDKETATVKVRYKPPTEDVSKLLSFPVANASRPFLEASENVRFATSVAAFGQFLRGTEHAKNLNLAGIQEWASHSKGKDEAGYRADFLKLVEMAQKLPAS